MRPYRGIDASERLAHRRSRFIEAGLDLLSDPPGEPTVRAICAEAGVAVRYFYESFSDKDDFAAEVFDAVIADLTATTQAAAATAPIRDGNWAGMANIVNTIASDARVGRLLFNAQLTNPVIAGKRTAATELLTAAYFTDLGAVMPIKVTERTKALSYFAVGGVGQTINAWLNGTLHLSPEELIDQLANVLDEFVEPRLHQPRRTTEVSTQ